MKSDQQQPTDATENWLRQTLGGHRPEAPADAWQRLAPHLPKHKRRRPFVFWVSWSAAGAAAALMLFWVLKNAAPTVGPSVALENGQPVAQAAPAVLPENLEKKEAAISAERPALPTVEVDFSKRKPTTATSPASFSEKNSLKTTSILPENSAATTPAEPDFSAKTTAATSTFFEKPAPLQAEDPIEKLPSKAFAPLLAAEKPLTELQFPTQPILPKRAKTPRFWLGIEAAPALFMRKNMGEMPAGLAFQETHPRPGRGWQAGVSLTAEPLKNWRVALGIQHLRQTHEAAHSATLRLMDGVCLNPHDPGLKEYQFQYAVVSGDEQNNLTLRLQQQDIGSTMPDDEPFTLDMKTVHRSAAWRVPLTVERGFGTGKWQGFVRGGAVVDFAEKAKIEVTHYTEACQDLCFQGSHMPAIQVSAPASASVGWLAGVGIERRVGGRAALRFEPFMIGQKGSVQCGLSLGLLFSN